MKSIKCLVLAALLLWAPLLRADEAAAGAKAKSVVPEQKDANRHEQFMKDKAEALKKGPIQLVFIGDSITDAWRHGEQNKLYNERWGKYNPYNIGISGDETQHVLWRIEHGELDGLTPNPKLAVMMIGTNNIGNQNKMSAEDTANGVEALVTAIQGKLPETKILLLGVFPRGDRAPEVNAKPAEINKLIASLDDGGKRVKFMDITEKLLVDGKLTREVMPDLLHPQIKGYTIWADAIGPTIDEMAK